MREDHRIDFESKTSNLDDDENLVDIIELDPSRDNILLNKDIMSSVFGVINNFNWSRQSKVRYSQRDNKYSSNVVQEEPLSAKLLSSDLPTSVLLEVFSYLDVISLCRIAQICQTWYNIANDNLLWERKLKQDSQRWEMVDHLSHPTLHIETNPELSFKEIYLRCCPECRIKRMYMKSPRLIPNLSFYFGFSIPRVVMFGSGLDSNGFVKGLLWDKKSPFTVKQMFPGQFEGTGSGVTLQHSGGSLNLITLYGMSKAEREKQASLGNERKSKLLVDDADQNNQMTLSQPVRELCSTVDAFIYIVNGIDKKTVNYGKEEFQAMLDPRWVNPKVPVLILCIVPDATVKPVPSIEVANELQLLKLSRPWQVRQCHISTLYGLMPGINWFTKRIMTPPLKKTLTEADPDVLQHLRRSAIFNCFKENLARVSLNFMNSTLHLRALQNLRSATASASTRNIT